MTDKTNINMDLLLQELQGKQDEPLRAKELFYLCMAKWQWFVVSVLLCVGIAVFYILCTPPVYTRSAFLMVKEDTKGKAIGSDVASMFADLGLGQMNANVNNELLAMRMPSVVKEVVERLALDMDYQVSGFLHKESLYGEDLPVKASLLELADTESASFTLRLQLGGKVELNDFESSKREVESKTVTGALNDTLRTPLGKMVLKPTASYSATEEYPLIYLSRTNLYDCVDGCIKNLEAQLCSEDATVIELSYKDVSIARAEDVLNTVITVYNEELRHFSFAYFHGHSVGGTNPSLLEAMACGCFILAHDNVFNKAVLMENTFYYTDEQSIVAILNNMNEVIAEKEKFTTRNLHIIREQYSWEKLTDTYEEYFARLYP